MIAQGDLHPGAKLPPERDLAKRFGVNRASVRQALKALEVMGVVRQRVGDGTYLTEDALSTLSAPLDFLLLVDGWAKDADANTAFAKSVGPLPFHAMSAYPYSAAEHFPGDAAHSDYQKQYNIRPALRLLRPLTE